MRSMESRYHQLRPMSVSCRPLAARYSRCAAAALPSPGCRFGTGRPRNRPRRSCARCPRRRRLRSWCRRGAARTRQAVLGKASNGIWRAGLQGRDRSPAHRGRHGQGVHGVTASLRCRDGRLPSSGSVHAQSMPTPATCKSQATGKKLAGAALNSFMKKCETGAQSACDASSADKRLSGAAKSITDAVGG
jgi:hypothetical protein